MSNLYPAQFEEVFDEHLISFSTGFVVKFRDVPEALTQGNDFLEAIEMAEDALSVAMEFYDEDNKPRPKPSAAEYGDVMINLLSQDELSEEDND